VVPFLKSDKFRRIVGKVITNYEKVYSNSVVYTENKEIPVQPVVVLKESTLPEIKSQSPPLVSVPTQVPVSVPQPKLQTKVEEKQEKVEIKDLNLKQKHVELTIEEEYDEEEDEDDVKLPEVLKTENITIQNSRISPNIIVQPSIVNTLPLSTTTFAEPKPIFNTVPQIVSISQPAINITNPQVLQAVIQNPPIVNATAQLPILVENKKSQHYIASLLVMSLLKIEVF